MQTGSINSDTLKLVVMLELLVYMSLSSGKISKNDSTQGRVYHCENFYIH